jgi:hypothetical protein
MSNSDIRPQNLLLTFEQKEITIQELLAVEKPNKQYSDPEAYKMQDDSNGRVAIYRTNPLALVPEGQVMDLQKMIVKIADFGKGVSSYSLIRLISSKLDQ